jgi:cytochrome c-type biogenesis protein CcmH/NrfG
MLAMDIEKAGSAILDSDEVQLLADLGFMAGNLGHGKEAFAIFDAMTVLRPGQVFVELGHALARMGTGHYQEAATQLAKKSLVAHPHSEDVRIFLGWSLMLAKRPDEARAALAPLLELPANTPSRRLAREFVNGSASPGTSLAALAASISSALGKQEEREG